MSGARPWLRSESTPLLELRIGERQHPALAGRDLLVAVEPERRRVTASADRAAVGVNRPERLARVFDDRKPEPFERDHVGRVPEYVDRNDRRRAIADCGGGSHRGRGSASRGRCRRTPAARARRSRRSQRRRTRTASSRPRRRRRPQRRAAPGAERRCRSRWRSRTARPRAPRTPARTPPAGGRATGAGAQHLQDQLLLALADHRPRERDLLVRHEPAAGAGRVGSLSRAWRGAVRRIP